MNYLNESWHGTLLAVIWWANHRHVQLIVVVIIMYYYGFAHCSVTLLRLYTINHFAWLCAGCCYCLLALFVSMYLCECLCDKYTDYHQTWQWWSPNNWLRVILLDVILVHFMVRSSYFDFFDFFLKWLILGLYWLHLGHIDNHMPGPDSSCGIRTHDFWILRHDPRLTAPSMQTL